MKIEFKKVPQVVKNFQTEVASVRIEGTFCKISPSLVKIDGNLIGKTTVQCSRCGENDTIDLNEKLDFLISDGIYKSDLEHNELVIEIDDGFIDFDEIIQSEISSIYSDYHICTKCASSDFIEQEF